MTTVLPEAPRRSKPKSKWRGWIVALLVIVALSAVGLGIAMIVRGSIAGNETRDMLTHTVTREDLVVTVTEDGNVESASNIDVKCQVAGGSTILWIVEDGKLVKKGDVLVRLDSSALEEQIGLQQIVCEKAQAMQIEAEKTHSAAELAVMEYNEGTFVQEAQIASANITIAMENLRSAENALLHAERMARKGYITPLQRDAQAFAVERARLELDAAQTARDVLVTFTKPKMNEELQSARDTAAAKMRAEQTAYQLEVARLEKLKVQLVNCTIVAPQDGMVVFEVETSRFSGRSEGPEVGEGAQVREGQSLIKLPDLNQMQVNVTVHESRVDQLRTGMRANINVQGTEYHGTLTYIANQPERLSFFSASVKEYSSKVRIDGRPESLKPGMTAQVEILVDHLDDVLTVPVLAVVQQAGQFYCWVKTPAGPERRPVVLGATNNKFIEIKDGLVEGDEVVLNPRAVVPDARSEPSRRQQVEDRFGTAPAESSEGEALPESGLPGGEQPPVDPLASSAGVSPPAGESGQAQAGEARGNPLRLDTDGDGKVSRGEAQGRLQSSFDQVDTDGDGLLDAAELSAARNRAGQQTSSGGDAGR